MSITFLSRYEVGRYDTVESVCHSYGISWRAISEIPANQGIRHNLPSSGKLATGLILGIPPHAGRLIKERLHALHRLRPGILNHFAEVSKMADTELKPLLSKGTVAEISSDITRVLSSLHEQNLRGVQELAGSSRQLVPLCTGLSHTHVAIPEDSKVVGSSADEMCGLYWTISPEMLQVWQNLYLPEFWSERWQSTVSDPWTSIQQNLNTISSVIVQKLDGRIRHDQNLDRELTMEFAKVPRG